MVPYYLKIYETNKTLSLSVSFSCSFFSLKTINFFWLILVTFHGLHFLYITPACFHTSSFNFLSKCSLSFCPLSLWMYDLSMSLHFFLFLIIPYNLFVADSPILPKYFTQNNLIFLVSLHSSSHIYNSQIYFQLLFQTWYSNIIVICLPKLSYVSPFVLVNYSFSHNKFQN